MQGAIGHSFHDMKGTRFRFLFSVGFGGNAAQNTRRVTGAWLSVGHILAAQKYDDDSYDSFENLRHWRMQRGCTHGCTTRSARRCAPAESNESPPRFLRQSEGQECLHSAQQCARQRLRLAVQ